MLELVITGGQTGCDQAGWRAARAVGIPTSGFMPLGFRTEDGDHPEFAEMYEAKEHESSGYPARTRANVNWCDSLVWFGDPSSRGGRLTLGLCLELAVATPSFVVPGYPVPFKMPGDFAAWLEQVPHRVLMVAGNRESSRPGIGKAVEAYLRHAFRLFAEAHP